MRILGSFSRTHAAKGAPTSKATPGAAVTRTMPSGAPSALEAARETSPAHSAIFRAGGTRRSPAALRLAPVAARKKSRAPMRYSRSAMCRLTVGCPTERRRAAALMLPVSATAKNTRISAQSTSIPELYNFGYHYASIDLLHPHMHGYRGPVNNTALTLLFTVTMGCAPARTPPSLPDPRPGAPARGGLRPPWGSLGPLACSWR